MKNLFVLIIGIAVSFSGFAQNEAQLLGSHGMLNLYGGHTNFSCEMDRISMNMFLKEDDIDKYIDCTKMQKNAITQEVLKQNAYLTKRNYSKSKASLRKYYDSVIEILSIPPSSSFSSRSEIKMQNATAEAIERRIKVEWNGFIMDLVQESEMQIK